LTYAALGNRLGELADFLAERGLRADPHSSGSDHLLEIPYAVAAGLGQLGLKGQLLTPAAGGERNAELLDR
jgi:epoxyqueuosine reductase